MTEQKKDFPDFYITAPQPCPYLPDRQERKLFTHLSREKPRHVIDHLLKNGFRRSQNIAYTPYCEGCSACTSVRIIVEDFEAKRTMRRIETRNTDLVARRLPPAPTSEQYALFRAYIDSRHGDGGMAEMSMLDYFMMVQDINHRHLRHRVPPATRAAKGAWRSRTGRSSASRCAIACRTASRWSTRSSSPASRSAASAPT